jgi:hypothetical protein
MRYACLRVAASAKAGSLPAAGRDFDIRISYF